jgi:hypothetical protein
MKAVSPATIKEMGSDYTKNSQDLELLEFVLEAFS